MPIIEEAIDKLTQEEKSLHSVVKDFDEDLLINYAIKRSFYKEMSKDEVNYINDIYESGTTVFDIIFLQKSHKIKLLSQKERNDINLAVDKKFNFPATVDKDKNSERFYGEENKKLAETEYRIVAIVASALVEIDGDSFDTMVSNHFKIDPRLQQKPTLSQRIEYVQLLPAPLVRILHERYIERESRIYEIFQFESIRKK